MDIRAITDDQGVTHKTGTLDSRTSVDAIRTALGLDPDTAISSDGKVTLRWTFIANNHLCGIWDYRGVRWSTYGDWSTLDALFPGNHQRGPVRERVAA